MAVAELSDALIGRRSSKRDMIYLFETFHHGLFQVLNISQGLDNRTAPLLWIFRPQSVHAQKNGQRKNVCQLDYSSRRCAFVNSSSNERTDVFVGQLKCLPCAAPCATARVPRRDARRAPSASRRDDPPRRSWVGARAGAKIPHRPTGPDSMKDKPPAGGELGLGVRWRLSRFHIVTWCKGTSEVAELGVTVGGP